MVSALLWVAVFAAITAIAMGPSVSGPVVLLIAALHLAHDVDRALLVVVAAAAVTTGRLFMALRARAVSAGTGTRQNPLARWLGQQRRYRQATFLAGFVPVVPASFVFPLLGNMRSPLRYALAGSLLGQLALYTLTIGVAVALARAVTANDRDGSWLLVLLSATWLVLSLTARFDRQHWIANRRVRMRKPWAARHFSMGGIPTGDIFADRPGGAAMHGHSSGMDERGGDIALGGVIEGEVLAEEEEDSDPDDDADGGRQHPRGRHH